MTLYRSNLIHALLDVYPNIGLDPNKFMKSMCTRGGGREGARKKEIDRNREIAEENRLKWY